MTSTAETTTAIAAARLQPFEWSATTILIVGSALVSVSPAWSTLWQVFTAFLIGHIIWSVVGYCRRNYSLVALNLGMVALDLYAIAVRTPFFS